MAKKEDYRTAVIEDILCMVEFGDSLERLKEYLAEATTLPYYARAHIANHIEQDFVKRTGNLNTNIPPHKLQLMADMDVERIRFVTDTLGKEASMPARIFAYKALGADSPAPESLNTRPENNVQALCETAKIVHDQVYSTVFGGLIEDFNRSIPDTFFGLASRIRQQPELTRLFIMERLERIFLEDKRDIIKNGLDDKRKKAQQFPLDPGSCTVNARILDFIVSVKGDAAPLFIRQLARDLASFRDEGNKDVKRYIELFLNAFEITEDGIDPVAKQEEECRDTVNAQIDNLKTLRPSRRRLKPQKQGVP